MPHSQRKKQRNVFTKIPAWIKILILAFIGVLLAQSAAAEVNQQARATGQLDDDYDANITLLANQALLVSDYNQNQSMAFSTNEQQVIQQIENLESEANRFLEQENYQAAGKKFARALTLDVSPSLKAKLYYNKAICSEETKQCANAVREFNLAIKTGELDKENEIMARYHRALCLMDIEQYPAAAKELTHTITQYGAEAHLNRATCWMKMKKHNAALKELDRAMTKGISKKYHADIHYKKATCYMEKENYKEARKEFITALKLKTLPPELTVDAYYHKVVCLMRLERYADTIQEFNQAIKTLDLKGRYKTNVHHNKAICLMLVEEYDAAIKLFETVIAHDEPVGYASEPFYYIAICHMEKNRYREAKTALSEAITLGVHPERQVTTHYSLTLCLIELGEYNTALNQLNQATRYGLEEAIRQQVLHFMQTDKIAPRKYKKTLFNQPNKQQDNNKDQNEQSTTTQSSRF
jgi:tetratricopeptide (TPR) repeat protein